jgi:hypothetical protein
LLCCRTFVGVVVCGGGLFFCGVDVVGVIIEFTPSDVAAGWRNHNFRLTHQVGTGWRNHVDVIETGFSGF